MSTGQVQLSTTEYTRVNLGLNPLVLQAHGDAVRVVLLSSQPSPSNSAFHVLSGVSSDPWVMPSVDTNVWAMAASKHSSLIVTEVSTVAPLRSAFGEQLVTGVQPIIQLTAQYGILEDALSANLGGTTDTQDSKFRAMTGTGATSVAALVSAREAAYRGGQGLTARFTALFTQGVPDSTQIAGFLTSESTLGFGFDGEQFGIVHARDGALEHQGLTVSVAPSATETAVITVDGVAYNVDIDDVSIPHVAFQIASSLNDQVPGYRFTSTGAVVDCLAQLPDFGAGVFSFVSDTAVATFDEIVSGALPVEAWTPVSQWNVNPNITIDPTLGNVYQVQMQYLGFGDIKFYIENAQNGLFELVHVIQYANTSTVPSVGNPVFRVGWGARNTGNTSNIVVEGASASVFVEGAIVYDGPIHGVCHLQPDVGTTRVNILTIRNRLSFNSVANRAEIIMVLLNMSTDTNKTAIFELIKSPVIAPGEFLDYQLQGENQLAEISKSPAVVTGGKVIACFNIKNVFTPTINLDDVIKALSPGEELMIAARVTSGNASEIDVSLTWRDDL